MRWWGYACHQCIQQHWRSWRKFWLLGYFQTSQKDVIKWTSFIRLASFKPISTPLTYSPVILLFDGFVHRKKLSERVWERCTLSLKSAYRTYNVLCRNYHFKWYCSNKHAHEYGVKKFFYNKINNIRYLVLFPWREKNNFILQIIWQWGKKLKIAYSYFRLH